MLKAPFTCGAITIGIFWLLLTSSRVHAQTPVYQIDDDATILAAARAIIAEDPDCALITTDESGQPRVRTVTASTPDEDMIIWIATRPDTRKVQQIKQSERVSLYFNLDAKSAYVSVMGRATLHDDLATKELIKIYEVAARNAFWPQYPDDYLLIKIVPEWIEVMGFGISGNPQTWRPQGVSFPPD
jgi:general stress protein 26